MVGGRKRGRRKENGGDGKWFFNRSKNLNFHQSRFFSIDREKSSIDRRKKQPHAFSLQFSARFGEKQKSGTGWKIFGPTKIPSPPPPVFPSSPFSPKQTKYMLVLAEKKERKKKEVKIHLFKVIIFHIQQREIIHVLKIKCKGKTPMLLWTKK